MRPGRPTFVDVDLGSIRRNVNALASLVAPSELCVVVKADAYGHGDVPVAEAALSAGATWLAVALVEEGIRLREGGIEAPILLLSEPPPDVIATLLRWRLTPTAYSAPFIEALTSAGVKEPVPVHLKVDTGMHRVGASPDRALSFAKTLDASPATELRALWTHFAVAEDDPEFTHDQLQALLRVADEIRRDGIAVPMMHAANSAGTLLHPEARLDMVRVGIATYGLKPYGGAEMPILLEPAMSVVSEVSYVRRLPAGARPSYRRVRPLARDAFVATVPIGYADGFPRLLSEEGEVLIRGERMPLAGRVTMDQIVIDCGDTPVEVGDEVVLIGSQGNETISAEEWAGIVATINYEIVCGLGPRVPRRYHG